MLNIIKKIFTKDKELILEKKKQINFNSNLQPSPPPVNDNIEENFVNWICTQLREYPENWKADHYKIKYRNGSKYMCLWIANGEHSIGPYEMELPEDIFTESERHKIWIAYKQWTEWKKRNYMKKLMSS